MPEQIETNGAPAAFVGRAFTADTRRARAAVRADRAKPGKDDGVGAPRALRGPRRGRIRRPPVVRSGPGFRGADLELVPRVSGSRGAGRPNNLDGNRQLETASPGHRRRRPRRGGALAGRPGARAGALRGRRGAAGVRSWTGDPPVSESSWIMEPRGAGAGQGRAVRVWQDLSAQCSFFCPCRFRGRGSAGWDAGGRRGRAVALTFHALTFSGDPRHDAPRIAHSSSTNTPRAPPVVAEALAGFPRGPG